jgi:hypothetical protein
VGYPSERGSRFLELPAGDVDQPRDALAFEERVTALSDQDWKAPSERKAVESAK